MDSVLIIAEAGVNHNGRLDLALKLVDAAKEAGADIVKFQTGKPELLISRFAEKAEYQKKNTDSDETQLEMIKKLSLDFDDFVVIQERCKEIGIKFLSTPFDLESIEFLNSLGVEFWKVPSGEITNLPYLEKIARTRKSVVMSTGMCTIGDVEDAIRVLHKNGTEDIVLLHCTTEYPAPYNEINLKAMETLKNTFMCNVGYSDHTEGIAVSLAAVALGASVIEKHFTLDKNLPGPDHKASLEPHELKEMVSSIRKIELSLGDGEKLPTESEKKNIKVARKSIVAKKKIMQGEIFTEDNLTTKRPGTGISPMLWNSVLGRVASRTFEMDELIEL